MSLFGSLQTTTTTAPANPFGGSLSQPQNQNPQQSTFGTSSLFNQPQAQQQQQPSQQQPQQNLGASLLNNSQMQQRSSVWHSEQDLPNQKAIDVQMGDLHEKWNPTSSSTVFRTYFYNKVDPSHVPFYARSQRETEEEWEKAVREKPGPGFIPAFATGFKGIGERLLMQKAVLAQFNARLHEINGNLDNILSRHDLETTVRAVNARRRHVVLRQRCLALASRVQVLSNRGYAMNTTEDDLKTKLEQLDRGMADPALSARTEELWSRLILLRGHADTLRNEINARGGDNGEDIPEEAEQKAKKLLEYYDQQLQELKKTVDRVKTDYDEWQKEHNPTTAKS
ncbi:nucleoporin complex subunit 54-domain-containing protein [Pestalotiopsis sp. NC0098]|nr:nucleoporin complex subunit 54-domain-containing protein [Pestalotiopsis sp. NC0098]